MTSLAKTATRFADLLRKTDGTPFFGKISLASERDMRNTDFSEQRLLLRVSGLGVVDARDIILDPLGRRYLVCLLGTSIRDGSILYSTYRLLEMNTDYRWRRQSKEIDMLTGLEKGQSAVDLGMIPVMSDLLGFDRPDSVLRISEDTRRIVTPALVQPGDTVDDAVVQRVTPVLGVTLAEIK